MGEVGTWKIIKALNYEHPVILKYEMISKSRYKISGKNSIGYSFDKKFNMILQVSDFVDIWFEEVEPRSLGKSLSASSEALNKLLYDILYKDEDKIDSDGKECLTSYYFDSSLDGSAKLKVKSKLGIIPFSYTFFLKTSETKDYIRREFIYPLLQTCQYLSSVIEKKESSSFKLDHHILKEVKNTSIEKFNKISLLIFNSLNSNVESEVLVKAEECPIQHQKPHINIEKGQIFTNEFLSLNEEQPHFLSLSMDSDDDFPFTKTQSDNWRRKDNTMKRKRKEISKKKFV